MTRIAVVGGGKAAALHADAVLHTRGVELVGVGGRPGSADELADQAGVANRPISELCSMAEALVVAVPPDSVPPVLEEIAELAERGGPLRALLVEPPIGSSTPPAIRASLGANLLHAPVVRQALNEIRAMNSPHHLRMRVKQPRPERGNDGRARFGGPLQDPGIRLASLLLSAAGEPAVDAVCHHDKDRGHAVINLQSGRTALLEVVWGEGSAHIELEAADEAGVVLLTIDPTPRLEIGGRQLDPPELHPLQALGFVPQIQRLVRSAEGADVWPDIGLGAAIEALLASS